MSVKHVLIILILTNILYAYFEITDILNLKHQTAYSSSLVSAIISAFILLIVILFFVKNEELIYLQNSNRLNKQYINLQQKQSEIIRAADKEIRRIRHDLHNHTICLNELYKDKKYDELGKYIFEMSDCLNETCKYTYTGYDIADAIIRDKKSVCRMFGGEIITKGKLNNIKIKPVDICTILSNILDNAIEATKNNKTDKRKIELSFKQTDNFIFISEKNYTQEKIVITDNHISSTKTDDLNHGFGLENIKKVIEKYSGEIRLDCSQQDQDIIFTIEIALPN